MFIAPVTAHINFIVNESTKEGEPDHSVLTVALHPIVPNSFSHAALKTTKKAHTDSLYFRFLVTKFHSLRCLLKFDLLSLVSIAPS